MKEKILIVAGGLIVLCMVMWVLGSGRDTEMAPLSEDSAEVQAAMEVLRAIVADTDAVPEHMAKGAPAAVGSMVAEVAKRMREAGPVEFRHAGEAQGYLRLGVACPREEGKPFEQSFFFVEEGGEMRIRGLQM